MVFPNPPKTWLAGEKPTAATLNAEIRDAFKAIGDPWTAYSPSWTTSGTAPSLGNGSLTGAYRQTGKFVTFRIRLLAGSTTTFGTGEFRFTYPATAINSFIPGLSGYIFRSGPSYFGIIGVGFATTSLRLITSSGNALVTATSPLTFTNGDELNIGGTYEAA